MDSILITIKKMLGIDADYNAYDVDIIVNINSVFMILNQLGVGPDNPVVVTGNTEEWSRFQNVSNMEALKSYTYLKVKLIFDPPDRSNVLDSYKEQIKEFEYRLRVQGEYGGGDVNE